MASQGPNNSSSATNSGFGGSTNWTAPSNVFASDNSYAQATGVTTFTNQLVVSGFGFSIPGGATITGIVVEIERKSPTSNSFKDKSITLQDDNGNDTVTNKADTSVFWPADAYKTYGSSSDLWGTAWTPAKVNDADFGVRISAEAIISGENAQIDHVRITVYYTLSVSDTLQIIHDVRAAVQDTLQVVYDVEAVLTVSDTLTLRHDVNAFVSDTLGLLFDVKEGVSDDLSVVYGTEAYLSALLTIKYWVVIGEKGYVVTGRSGDGTVVMGRDRGRRRRSAR